MSIPLDAIALTANSLSCSAVTLLFIISLHDRCEVIYLVVGLQGNGGTVANSTRSSTAELCSLRILVSLCASALSDHLAFF